MISPGDSLVIGGRPNLVIWSVEQPDYCIVPVSISAYESLVAALIVKELRG